MLNRLARYLPVLKTINDQDNLTVLEIGSGPAGLAEFYTGTIIGCDLGFRDPVIHDLIPVCASGVALPFPDRAFPLVVCLDVLEHIRPSLRQAFLQEALRVTAVCLILGFPTGVCATLIDRLLALSYRIRHRVVPDWLNEHSMYPFPESQAVTNILESNGLHTITLGNENVLAHFFVMLTESSRCIEPRLTRSVLGKDKVFWQRLLPRLEVAPFYRRMIVAKYPPSNILK